MRSEIRISKTQFNQILTFCEGGPWDEIDLILHFCERDFPSDYERVLKAARNVLLARRYNEMNEVRGQAAE